MKITIEIPEAFECDWKKDKFKDAFMRLKMDAHAIAGLYEKEICDMFIQAFDKAEEG